MYSIANIIYGIPYSQLEKQFDKNKVDPNDQDYFFEEIGEGLYSGDADGQCGYFGLELDSFNACGDDVEGSEIADMFTKHDISKLNKQYLKLLQDVPVEFQKYLKNPKIWLVWSTS